MSERDPKREEPERSGTEPGREETPRREPHDWLAPEGALPPGAPEGGPPPRWMNVEPQHWREAWRAEAARDPYGPMRHPYLDAPDRSARRAGGEAEPDDRGRGAEADADVVDSGTPHGRVQSGPGDESGDVPGGGEPGREPGQRDR